MSLNVSSTQASKALSIAGFDIRTRPFPPEVQVHDIPLLNQLYAARGVRSEQELDTSLSGLLSWRLLHNIDLAVDLLLDARDSGRRVLVVGDYDTDGATSTALAVLGLTAFGINVDYLLPNRFEFGYGLSPEIVDIALQKKPDIILTVDNGIASFAGISKARAAGVDVLVTDHHLPAQTLPEASVIVNPNQPDCAFPSKAACGCTVLYYLLIALRARLREQGESQMPNLGQWLDLVALATVADVVPLDANNRKLVQQGLQRIRGGACRVGIKALFEVAGRSWQNASSQDFGFVVGPRLNAAGRLDDMTIGVQLLLTENQHEARNLAAQLHELNQQRRQIEASMLDDISNAVMSINPNSDQHGVIVFGDDWHEGVIGIVASRVKEKCHKPVVAFAPADNGTLKGSARSIPGIHMRDCLDWITKQTDQIIEKFGGHAMAAGLTIRQDKLAEFEKLFNQAVTVFAEADALTPQYWTDGEIPVHWLTLESALQLEASGPWGQAFPPPEFFGQWPVVQSRVLKEKHLKVTLAVGDRTVEGIAFNVDDSLLVSSPQHVRGVYQLGCNRFRDQETLQLMFSKIEAV